MFSLDPASVAMQSSTPVSGLSADSVDTSVRGSLRLSGVASCCPSEAPASVRSDGAGAVDGRSCLVACPPRVDFRSMRPCGAVKSSVDGACADCLRCPDVAAYLASGGLVEEHPGTDRGALLTNPVSLVPNESDLAFVGPRRVAFHIDWLAFTVHGVGSSLLDVGCGGFPFLMSQLVNILCVGVVDGLTRRDLHNWEGVCCLEPRAGRGYLQRWTLPGGITVYADPVNPDQKHVHVEIKGDAATAIGALKFRLLFGMLDGRFAGRWLARRIDLAWDGVPFTPDLVKASVIAGDVRTRATRAGLGWHESPLDPNGGRTCTLGSRASDFYLRVYDKRGPTRCELQVMNDRASLVVRFLADVDVSRWSAVALGHLRDFVDFVDSDSDPNITRASLLEWWSSFLGGADRARVVMAASVLRPLAKIDEWFRHKIGATAAMLVHAILFVTDGNFDAVMDLVLSGRTRWTGRHKSILTAAGIPLGVE